MHSRRLGQFRRTKCRSQQPGRRDRHGPPRRTNQRSQQRSARRAEPIRWARRQEAPRRGARVRDGRDQEAAGEESGRQAGAEVGGRRRGGRHRRRPRSAPAPGADRAGAGGAGDRRHRHDGGDQGHRGFLAVGVALLVCQHRRHGPSRQCPGVAVGVTGDARRGGQPRVRRAAHPGQWQRGDPAGSRRQALDHLHRRRVLPVLRRRALGPGGGPVALRDVLEPVGDPLGGLPTSTRTPRRCRSTDRATRAPTSTSSRSRRPPTSRSGGTYQTLQTPTAAQSALLSDVRHRGEHPVPRHRQPVRHHRMRATRPRSSRACRGSRSRRS